MTTDLSQSGIAQLAPLSVGKNYDRAAQRSKVLIDDLYKRLGALAKSINHIGGTAVPRHIGRPTIDLLLITPDLYEFDQHSAELEARGYRRVGDGGLVGQRLFSLGQGIHCEAQLYVYEPGDLAAVHHLLLRDYLRTHPADAYSYGELKSRLATTYMTNSAAYLAAKRPRLERLLQLAKGRSPEPYGGTHRTP